MVCYNCGQTCADGVRFCTNCGADLAAATNAVNTAANPAMQGMETAPAQKEKKPVNKKMAGLVAIILIVMCVIALMNSKPDYVTAKNKSILMLERDEDNVVAIFANGKILKMKHESANSVQYSVDRTVACFINEDEEVIVVRNGKEIKTGVEEVSALVLSVYGDTFAYVEEAEYDDEARKTLGDLYLYDIKKGKKSDKIEGGVSPDSIVLSPNGKTVAFTADWEYDEDERESSCKGYYSINGKEPKKIGNDAETFAIADKAKYIYYLDEDRVYVKKKNKDEGEKIATKASLSSFIVNEDLSQMILTVVEDGDVKTFMTEKGKKSDGKISGSSVSGPILPSDAMKKSLSSKSAYGTFSGVESLEELLYTEGDEKLSYLTKKGELETVLSSCRSCRIADDMESLVYLDKDGDLFKVTNFAKGGKKKEICKDTDAYSIYASGDLKYIYYVDDDELYCVKGKKAKRVADEVGYIQCITPDGKGCYYTEEIEDDDDEAVLYYVKKTGKSKEVVSAEYVDVSNYYGTLIAECGDDDEVTFNLVKGKKLKEIYKSED